MTVQPANSNRRVVAELVERMKGLQARALRYGNEELLDALRRAAGIDLEWEPPGAWSRRAHGCGLLAHVRGTFVIRIPRQTSAAWNRFVVAHELAHSLFYKPTDCSQPAFRPARDLWVERDFEESLCDEIADILLMPEAIVHRFLSVGDGRLAQVDAISRSFGVPVDRAYRRRDSILRLKGHSGEPDRCAEIAVWQIPADDHSELRPDEKVHLVYAEGAGHIHGGKYSAQQAGLSYVLPSYPEAARSASLSSKAVPVTLGRLSGRFDVEIFRSRSSPRRLLVAYDRTDGGQSVFSSEPLLPLA